MVVCVCVCFMLCLLCMFKHIFRNMGELLSISAAHLESLRKGDLRETPSRPKAAGAEPPNKMMKHSDMSLDELRRKFKNTLQIVTAVLISRWNHKLATMLTVVVRPIRTNHGNRLVMSKSLLGLLQVSVDMASGRWNQELLDIVKHISDRETWKHMGMLGTDAEHVDEDEADMEKVVANYTMRFVLALLGRRLLAGLAYTMSLPHAMAKLLQSDESAVSATLKEMSSWWDTLWEAEKARHDRPSLADALHDCIWPAMQWPRRLLIGLAEVEFMKVPDWIRSELLAAFGGFSATKCVEDLFHDLRRLESKSESGAFDRKARWLGALESKVLLDCKRPPAAATSATKRAARVQRVPADMFDAEAGDCSVTAAEFETLMAQKTTWRFPSADNFARVPLIWMSALHAKEKGFGCLDRGWMNLLAAQGMVVQVMSSGDKLAGGGLVVHVSASGLLVWKVQWVKGCGPAKQVFVLQHSEVEQNWRYLHLDDCSACQAAEIIGISPRSLKQLLSQPMPTDAISFGFEAKAGNAPLLAVSAAQGFPNLRVTHLKQFAKHLELKFARSAGEADLIKLIIPEVLGPEADVSQILELRNKVETPEMQTVLDPEGIELVKDCFDVDDEPELKQAVDKAKHVQRERRKAAAKVVEKAKAAVPPGEGAASSSSGSAVAPAAKRHHLPGSPGDEWDLDGVRKLLSKVASLRVSREVKFHRRWRMSYPCESDPRSFNRCWGAQLTETEVVHAGMKFMWAVHARETGAEDCPYILDQ